MTNRATLLCLAIGLAAFIIGVCVAQFRLPPVQNETAFERSTPRPKPEPAFVNSVEQNLTEIRFVCNDDRLLPFWNDLLPEISHRIFNPNIRPLYDCAEFLKVEEIDLNNNHENEIIVTMSASFLCSNTVNCPVAIYQRGRFPALTGSYRGVSRILFSPSAGSYSIEGKTINGFPNLLLRENGVNNEDYVTEYEFDGRYYRSLGCYGEDTTTLKRWDDCDS